MKHDIKTSRAPRNGCACVAVLCLIGTSYAAPPSVSVAALVESGERAMRSDPDASRRDAESALEALKRAPDPDLEIRAHLLLCDYQSERDSSAAQQEIAAASALLPQAKRQALRAGVLLCQGETFETAGDNAKAMGQYQQAVTLASRLQDEDMLAESLFSRGYLFGVQGQYARGLADLKRAEALFESLNKPLHALTTLDAVATLYNRIGDYAEAQHIYLQALKTQHAEGLQREQAVTLNNLGRADENLRDWEAARQAFSECLEISRQINYPRGEAYALRGLAAVANALGDADGALETLQRADVLQRQTTDARLHAQIELAKGIAFHKLRRLSESTASLEQAMEVFRQADALHELSLTYSELAAVYAEEGSWRAAFDQQSLARETSEKLLLNQIDQRFATLKVEFDTAAKEKENQALLRQNEANERALTQARSVRHLQATVIVMAALLALMLAMLAVFQHRATARMHYLAMTDELTGVPNRRAVLARMEALLRDARARLCSILIVDIDHFKAINDDHGHPAGDEVLKAVAEQVRRAVLEPAFFGRLGGEEFLIVLPDTGLEEARRMAECFRERIESVDVSIRDLGRHRITASIGVAVSAADDHSPSSMLNRADSALYAAKRGGRNRVMTQPASVTESSLVLDV